MTMKQMIRRLSTLKHKNTIMKYITTDKFLIFNLHLKNVITVKKNVCTSIINADRRKMAKNKITDCLYKIESRFILTTKQFTHNGFFLHKS